MRSDTIQNQPLEHLGNSDQVGNRTVVGWILNIRSSLLDEWNDVAQLESCREHSVRKGKIGQMSQRWGKNANTSFEHNSRNFVDRRGLAPGGVDDGGHFILGHRGKSAEVEQTLQRITGECCTDGGQP